jgi:ATP-binding cassette, subfamily F, member 3
MLKLKSLSISRGAKQLIQNIDLDLFPGQIIGIVGKNGCGKSSLFGVLEGHDEAASGEVEIKSGTRVVILEQEVPALSCSALEYVMMGDPELSDVYKRLAHAEAVEDYELMMTCHSTLSEIDGYSAEAQAAKILNGLGFTQEGMKESVSSFSGGWRMRLNLAKCLFSKSDCLLLDEPTNHLDMETIIWVENFLKSYKGGVLMVSHDREFLDHTVTHIAHIEHQGLKLYPGDYSRFELQRAEALAVQQAQFEKQKAKIDHMMQYVERFRYKASKAKQAQSRLKAVERMEKVSAVLADTEFNFEFFETGRMPNPMFTMRKVNLGYDENTILKNIKLSIYAGERIGLLGMNGAGKSTLIKAICGELKPLSGIIETPTGINVGYFAQHQVDFLPLDESPLMLLGRIAKGAGERDLTRYLGGFAFDRDQMLTPLKTFSGGEKSRVALALMIWQRPNLLLLDEPTNHLDMDMRQALGMALQNYDGAMVLVSHDRYLLKTLVDELWQVGDGGVIPYEGSVDQWGT